MSNDVFPTPIFFDESQVGCSDGLTKRELFAALALAGHLAGDGALCAGGNEVCGLDTPETAARKAIQYADELIKQLREIKP